MVFRFLLIFFVVGVLVACSPEPTPFPVDIVPEVTETPLPQAVESIRYALAANTTDAVADLALLQESAAIEFLAETIQPQDLGTRYDLVAAYGDFPESTRGPVTLTVALVLQTQIDPLDDPDIQAVLRRSIDSARLVAGLEAPGAVAQPTESETSSILQAELANAGWPDGFNLTLANAYAPSSALIAEQLGVLRIRLHTFSMSAFEAQTMLSAQDAELALITWTTPEEREAWAAEFGAENVIDLFTVPISYRAVPGLNITFTPGGWPLPSR